MTRPGFSLLELIVVIAILGLLVGIVAVAPLRRQPAADLIQISVRTALSSGHTVVSRDSLDGGGEAYVSAYPSGTIVIDTIYMQEHVTTSGSTQR